MSNHKPHVGQEILFWTSTITSGTIGYGTAISLNSFGLGGLAAAVTAGTIQYMSDSKSQTLRETLMKSFVVAGAGVAMVGVTTYTSAQQADTDLQTMFHWGVAHPLTAAVTTKGALLYNRFFAGPN